MGSLEPGANYIYERVDDRIYARKFGETKWAKAHTFRCRKYKVAQQAHRELVGEVWI